MLFPVVAFFVVLAEAFELQMDPEVAIFRLAGDPDDFAESVGDRAFPAD